jgi:hypothetical protein
MSLIPLASSNQRHPSRSRVQVMHLDPERLPAADVALGAEDRSHASSVIPVPAQRVERTRGVGIRLQLVVRTESLPEIADEPPAYLELVMNNAQKRFRI